MPPMKRKEAAASSKAMQIVDSKKLKKDQDLFDAVDNLIGALDSPPKKVSDVVEEFNLLKIIDNHVKETMNVPRWYKIVIVGYAVI